VLATVCAAALATFVAIRFVPAAHIHDNSVDDPPWPLSLGLAVFGAVIGIFLVGGASGSCCGVGTSSTATHGSRPVPRIPTATASLSA
jgi:hypothetical protein